MPKLVEFRGERYWLIRGKALAPLAHCNENGRILLAHLFSESFAHLCEDGALRRYGRQIGTTADLIEVKTG